MDDRSLLDSIRHLIGEDETADDCAGFDLSDGRILVSSTDMLHETTDFPKGMTEFEKGWMSAAVTLSDIASCGAQPIQLLVAVGLDDPARLVPFMEGAVACAESVGAKVAGGDIDSHTELTVVTTGFGIVERSCCCRRTGASPGDLVCITGTPGLAMAALEGDERYRKNLLTPVPQVKAGQKIARAKASSMMDISDGLAISLYDMAQASGVGFVLDSKNFNLPDVCSGSAREYYLYGGGDFGLLFCIPPACLSALDTDYTVIGTVVSEKGVWCDGDPVEKRGYAHSW
ncbi:MULTISPECIES: thiamine-phosphate kinase [Methanocorpusculum]|jgi:thiamine-monophosphate kinase|uniref:Thiamine-monophosphate kinase n=1 Tax=Methanocorpusculum parvum TaxID=2193 RepID=A0AAX0Q8A6_9EURY|nr:MULTISPECIES: thiamine-phosphate kinase [Methanocorpusculum]MDD2248802.1 thiamine-phosphate kinase [Methanocorpusculum sp.]MDD2803282.1 thiamine-phosphate kinase [Methanocorpusculum sp.]MDD4423626.1 thiamine-phosphate kinase [Methanocorpusculum parvum]PAV09615.1 thiamine-monophosphate kinase [Methanocorpusculum parvum]